MSTSLEFAGYDARAFDRGIDPVMRILTPEQATSVARDRADEALHRRIAELAAKCNEGELTAAEQAEYAGYVRANKFVAILQAQARKLYPQTATS